MAQPYKQHMGGVTDTSKKMNEHVANSPGVKAMHGYPAPNFSKVSTVTGSRLMEPTMGSKGKARGGKSY